MKRLFKFIVITSFLLGPIQGYANVLTISNTYNLDDFSIDIPNTFERVGSDELLLYFVEDFSDKALAIVYGTEVNFGSHDPLYKYGDISTIKTRKSFFLRLNKTYKKQYLKADNISLLYYSFKTYNNTYSILFKYSSEKELEQINNIISSIKIKDSWGKRLLSVLQKGTTIWFIYLIILSFFSAGIHVEGEPIKETAFSALFITIFTIPLLLLFLWGAWDLFFTFLAITFIIAYLSARCGVFISPISE